MNFSKLISIFFVSSLFCYAFSGLLKWFFLFIDPTLFFGILTTLSIPFYIKIHKIHLNFQLNNVIWLYLVIHLLVFLSIFYTVSDNYYLIKSGKILFNLLALLIPILILRNNDSFQLLKVIARYSLIFALFFLSYELISNNLYRIRHQENPFGDQLMIPDYMSISYYLGTMILFLWDTKSKTLIIMLISAFIFMILLAAKGPILFLLLCVFIFYGKSFKLFNLKSFYLIFILVLLIGVANSFLGDSIFNNLISRLSFFDGGIDADKSSFDRLFLMSKSIDLISDNIFLGVGIGGFSKYISGEDGRLSPHNIFLELWSEVGILSLVLLITLIYSITKQFRKYLSTTKSVLGKSIISVNLYMFLAVIVSSYFEDIRLTNFWIGASIAFFSLEYQKKNNVRYNRNSK